jgi:hypothetical protein
MNGLEEQTAALLRQMGLRYRSQYRPADGIAPVAAQRMRNEKRIGEEDD